MTGGAAGIRLLAPAALLAAARLCAQAGGFPVTVDVDASQGAGEVRPIWRFFGADEPNYATMKDGQKLLSELGELRPGDVYFRAHNLLNTGDGTPALKWGSTNAYTLSAGGRPVYDWTIVDRIFDSYLARGVHPYVEVGFMPEALSTHPLPYRHSWRPGLGYDSISTGWAYPPSDYARWGELVGEWASHCAARYGGAEVARWYWETWNEPNLPVYWHGTPEEYYKLHDYAVAAIRRAIPGARVGGPDVAGFGGSFMQGFLAHCAGGRNYATGGVGTPTDFLSFHAKGSPSFVDGHVRLGISAQLAEMDRGFRMIAASPLRDRPVVIGESDPDGCAACLGPQLGYRTGTMYSSYTAATVARECDLADRDHVRLEGALNWSFEFEDQPYFAGQRVMATNGIDLPVLNVFRMFSRMAGTRIRAASSAQAPLDEVIRDGVRGSPDVGAIASLDGRRMCVLLWHYHDDDVPGPPALVSLRISPPGGARGASLTEFRIDAGHANAAARWRAMGSPQTLNDGQYAALVDSGRLKPEKAGPEIEAGAPVRVELPRQGVWLGVLDWR
ncbi:MAG TPA: beta-xylosidase [Opitutaceae bacterium]